MMKQVCKFLQKIELSLISLFLAGMVGVVFLATIARYSGMFTTPWAEEAARYMMIWLTFIGAGAVARTGSHFGIDVITKRLSDKPRTVFYILEVIVVTAICAWIAYYGIFLCANQIRMSRTSPSMNLPMWLVSSCVPYAAISCGIQNLLFSIDRIRTERNAGFHPSDEGGIEI